MAEGWHGVRFEHQLEVTPEYSAIVRQILRREGPLRFEGSRYRLPLAGARGMPLILSVRSKAH